MIPEYRPQAYWEERLSSRLDLTTVGHAGLGYTYNSWLYRGRFRALGRALRAMHLDVRAKAVLEVGVGSGAYIPFWLSLGVASFTGLDITSASVRTLHERYPSLVFTQADIGAPLPADLPHELLGQTDFVTAFDVLFHVTDDVAFSQAIGNLAQLVRPDGWVLISDGFADRSPGPAYHQHHRSLSHYQAELEQHGLAVAHLEPVFYTMTTTFAPRMGLSRATEIILRVVRKLAARSVTEPANQALGMATYALDGLLCRSGTRGPSLNVLMATRKETGGAPG
jgi:SAM-dependent methyltransferase